MLIPIIITVAALLAVFALFVASRPSEFQVTRSATVAAPPDAVFPHVNDLHNWEAWSPWLELDPNAKKNYSGASSGVGAAFAWDGNNKVGAGSMSVTESRPYELIRLKLDFMRPFKGTNTAEFTGRSPNPRYLGHVRPAELPDENHAPVYQLRRYGWKTV